MLWLVELQIRRGRKVETPVHTVNGNSRTANCQFNLFSKKHPIIRIFCISEWLAVPINPVKWSSAVLEKARILSVYEVVLRTDVVKVTKLIDVF